MLPFSSRGRLEPRDGLRPGVRKVLCYLLVLAVGSCTFSAILVRGSHSRLQMDNVDSGYPPAEGRLHEPFDGAGVVVVGAPFYEHDPVRLQLSAAIRIPQTADCSCTACTPAFVAISLYSDDYVDRAERMQASCVAHGVCCSISRVPPDALGPDAPVGSATFRRRLIASKPLFMLAAHAQMGLPIAWVDVDFEFASYPELFRSGMREQPAYRGASALCPRETRKPSTEARRP